MSSEHAGATVYEFPDMLVRQWLPYERMLRETYTAGGKLGPTAIDDMLSRLRPVFLKHARLALDNPGAQRGASNPFDEAMAWVAQLTMGLLLEIAAREGRLIDLGSA